MRLTGSIILGLFAGWAWCSIVDFAFDRFDRWRYRKWPQYDARSLTEKSKP